MLKHAISHRQPAPAGVEAECAYLDWVLAFQVAHGGPFVRSVELEYAVRCLTRAWIGAGLAGRGLQPWFAFAATTACVDPVAASTLASRFHTWATDEYRCVLIAPSPRSSDSPA